ncbi:TrbI/VirB10 family protein [Altererythrobacter aquiaggeris]|uniref:TrbI/VirB10 family protein n=1 Tax=Aestuarierythrobacter aquiaggeris TaxID=1898396 RepID=UPI00301B5541
MRIANKLSNTGMAEAANDVDPREGESAEIIDLASRNSFPAVTQRKGKSDGLGLAAGVAVVGLLGAVTLWSLNATRTAPPESIGNPEITAPPPAVVAAPPAEAGAVPAPAIAPRADPAPSPVLAAPPQTNYAPMTNPYASPTIVFDSGASAAPFTGASAVPSGPGPDSSNGTDFASRIGGVGGGPAQAARTVDPRTTVTQGTLIPAILETAINTDVPGYVRAVVSQDVRSFDGVRILVPRSSRLIGQYQSGLQAGQKRAYVIWTRVIRPDGVSVDLASPATGFDGTAGLPGKVNNHFFKRFGSAMLLSVVGGLSTIASGGASVVVGGGSSAAAAAVTDGGKIGPTVRVRQGEPIRVFTARDLDFSQVSS